VYQAATELKEMMKKIISSGQTSADRAALGFSLEFDIRHGGWIPKRLQNTRSIFSKSMSIYQPGMMLRF
jgi:hypothetical protein